MVLNIRMSGMVPAGPWGVNAGLDGVGTDTYNGPALKCPQRHGKRQRTHLKGGTAMAEDTFDSVQGIIVELLAVDPSKVTKEARFREDLGADSLDLVELIMAFEEKFGAEISDEDAQKILTVGEAVKYIDDRKKAA
jgi:acyl carrier protein